MLLVSINRTLYIPEYIKAISAIADKINNEQSADTLVELREKLYNIINSCIPYEEFFSLLVKNLITERNYQESTNKNIIVNAAFYCKRCLNGSKYIVHIEAYLARLMLLIFKDNELRNRLIKK